MEYKDTEYKIKVKTGSYRWAGTDNYIKLEIIGSKGRTEMQTLDNIFRNDFERGQTDEFTIKDIDVGCIEFIGLLVKRWLLHEDRWYVEYIEIGRSTKDENEFEDPVKFPIYSWFVPSPGIQYFFTNRTCIPQNESTARKTDTKRAQQTMKDSIIWNKPKERMKRGFPGYIDEATYETMNLNFKFTDAMDRNFDSNRKKALSNVAFKAFEGLFKDFSQLKHYLRGAKDLNKHFVKSIPWLENDLWKKDDEFGRQMLNSINPATIERCTGLPTNFAVNSENINNLLTRDLSLEKEIELGNIYIINYKILEGIPTGHYPFEAGTEKGTKLELAVPMCLLYHGSDDKLRPIAIQLGQEPGPDFPVWTPNDQENDWLLAKIWFRNADYQVHQMKNHLAFTHLLAEPIAVATFRCLPPAHPVHKLLREHLQFVIAINTIGRECLLREVREEKSIAYIFKYKKILFYALFIILFP